jgi:hypothetical protein
MELHDQPKAARQNVAVVVAGVLTLPPQDSARLRDGMVADIEVLLPQAAAAWAAQMLPSKSRLTTDDARAVEQAFEARFATRAEGLVDAPPAVPSMAPDAIGAGEDSSDTPDAEPQTTETTSSPQLRSASLRKTVRHRNKEHLKFLRTQPCLVCGRQPSDAHHLRFAQPQALGRKVSDEFTVPLCRTHHREAHRTSREITWWQSHGVAPLAAADALWKKSQSGQGASECDPPRQKSAKL